MAVRELVTMYGVDHEHIVACHDVFYSNSCFHLVMELMDGGSLLDALSRASTAVGPMPPQALAAVAGDILSALAFLHNDLEVIHRDIKPGNILLSASGQAKLADLGIATRPGEVFVDPRGGGDAEVLGCGCSTPAVEWIGTMKYMSPQRLSGDAYSFSADVWSLGIVLLEAALGRFPLTEALLAAASRGTAPSASRGSERGEKQALEFWDLHDIVTNGDCPSRLLHGQGAEWTGLRVLVAGCLAKQEAGRPSARDLLLLARRTGGGMQAAAPASAELESLGCACFLDCAEPRALAAWVQAGLACSLANQGEGPSGGAAPAGREVLKNQARCREAGEAPGADCPVAERVQGLVEHEGSEADGWL